MIRRVPQLDGLRGLAVALVVAAHVWNGVTPHTDRGLSPLNTASGGGLFGVHLFFVLSGFLITNLLLAEHAHSGAISLRSFYARRARRLLPALGAVVAFYLVVRVRDAGGLGDVARAMFYIENLRPFVDRIPHDGWLEHTWSLAIEEQFYLVWPLVLLLALRRSRRTLINIAIAVIVVTLTVRHALTSASTLLRWDALLLGCLLAIVPVRVPRPVGVVAFGVLVGSVVWVPSLGALPTTVATLVSGVALCAAPDFQWLSSSVLRYLGRISYGLYLWHVVIMRFGSPILPSVALGVVVADLSYRFVERPFLKSRDLGGGIAGGFVSA